MPQDTDQSAVAAGPEAPRPGQLSALLHELIRSDPDVAPGPWDQILQPGAQVGRFELVREVGRGAFGIVYEARDTELGRTVAFKALSAAAQPEVREERLQREAEAAARLSHPNIVTLFDVGRTERGGPYLVLEYLRGHTLAAELARGPLVLAEALRIARDVAAALAHAHAHGVVHRDLTPGNVFLCDDGQVKVLDFGMAHAFGRRTLRGGTPAYMAPEQERGAPEDERTDVFALGVILYRMLTGALPFESPAQLATPRPARRVTVAGMRGIGDLVARMLEKDPVARPRDASEVLAALGECLDEERRSPGASGGVRGPRRRARQPRVARGARPAPANAIAVLPFANMSADPAQEYFSDGLAEEILNALAQVEGLRVTGRTSSFSFKGKNDDLRTIGELLGVSTVLEGSVRKAGSRIRMTAHLVRVADGFHVWSQSYDREMTDIFAVQDEIARAVVDALAIRLLRRKRASRRAPFAGDADAEAYAQYLLGRHLFNHGTVDGFRLSIEAYRRALALDAAHAPAQAGIARALMWFVHAAGGAHEQVAEGQSRIVEAAERAVALGPALADGYAARGDVRTHVLWDWRGARADFERALALRPGDATARLGHAHLTAVLGRLRTAITLVRETLELDPLATEAWTHLGAYLNATGELAAARAALQRALAIAPEHSVAVEELGLNHLLAGEPAAALGVIERSTEPLRRLLGFALAQHDLGRASEVQRTLDDAVQRWSHVGAYQIAEIHAWRGQLDRAFEWLERSRVQRDPGLRRLKYDPRLKTLRGDARYAAMLRTLDLPPE